MGEAQLCRRGGNTFRGLVIVTPPARTAYFAGEYADLSGMAVAADFGTFTLPLSETAWTYAPTGPLAESDTAVTVTAEIGGRTGTVSVPITVSAVNPVFGENSWTAIARVAALGQAGDYWSVGDSKTEGGITYTIIGMDHDSLSSIDAMYSDPSYNGNSHKAAITIQVMTAAGPAKMNETDTNVGGWDTCYLRGTVLPAYIANMPDDLRSVLRTVDKQTSIGGYNTTEMVVSMDRLFLLAMSEMRTVSNNYTVLADEIAANPEYDYYANVGDWYKGVTEWTRSPHAPRSCNTASHFMASGNTPDYIQGNASTAYSYFPAFCI